MRNHICPKCKERTITTGEIMKLRFWKTNICYKCESPYKLKTKYIIFYFTFTLLLMYLLSLLKVPAFLIGVPALIGPFYSLYIPLKEANLKNE